MFARRTKTGIKPMFENEFETIASDIGSQTIVVRRANTRFAPTLISDTGWISITTIYPKIYDRLLSSYLRQSRMTLSSNKRVFYEKVWMYLLFVCGLMLSIAYGEADFKS